MLDQHKLKIVSFRAEARKEFASSPFSLQHGVIARDGNYETPIVF